VMQPFQRVSDSIYSGQLRFTVQIPSTGKSKNNPGRSRTGIIDIFTVKQEKVFGKDTVDVWNVLLGAFR